MDGFRCEVGEFKNRDYDFIEVELKCQGESECELIGLFFYALYQIKIIGKRCRDYSMFVDQKLEEVLSRKIEGPLTDKTIKSSRHLFKKFHKVFDKNTESTIILFTWLDSYMTKHHYMRDMLPYLSYKTLLLKQHNRSVNSNLIDFLCDFFSVSCQIISDNSRLSQPAGTASSIVPCIYLHHSKLGYYGLLQTKDHILFKSSESLENFNILNSRLRFFQTIRSGPEYSNITECGEVDNSMFSDGVYQASFVVPKPDPTETQEEQKKSISLKNLVINEILPKEIQTSLKTSEKLGIPNSFKKNDENFKGKKSEKVSEELKNERDSDLVAKNYKKIENKEDFTNGAKGFSNFSLNHHKIYNQVEKNSNKFQEIKRKEFERQIEETQNLKGDSSDTRNQIKDTHIDMSFVSKFSSFSFFADKRVMSALFKFYRKAGKDIKASILKEEEIFEEDIENAYQQFSNSCIYCSQYLQTSSITCPESCKVCDICRKKGNLYHCPKCIRQYSLAEQILLNS
jgi:predicted RNA-binding Zn-ribbon protein involved in translation (DUF1610 family)